MDGSIIFNIQFTLEPTSTLLLVNLAMALRSLLKKSPHQRGEGKQS